MTKLPSLRGVVYFSAIVISTAFSWCIISPIYILSLLLLLLRRTLLLVTPWCESRGLGYIALPLRPVIELCNLVISFRRSLVQACALVLSRFFAALVKYVCGTRVFVYSSSSSSSSSSSAPALLQDEGMLIICNHRTRVDWMYSGWCYSAMFHTHGGRGVNPTVVLKRSLQLVPFLGWFMQMTGYLFLSRCRNQDLAKIKACIEYWLNTQDRPNLPNFYMFPEGTDLSDSNVKKSHAFAREKNLPLLHHVLYPKTAGILTFVETIRNWQAGFSRGKEKEKDKEEDKDKEKDKEEKDKDKDSKEKDSKDQDNKDKDKDQVKDKDSKDKGNGNKDKVKKDEDSKDKDSNDKEQLLRNRKKQLKTKEHLHPHQDLFKYLINHSKPTPHQEDKDKDKDKGFLVHDITIAYKDFKRGVRTSELSLLMGEFPPEIHLCVDRHRLGDVPADQEGMTGWLRTSFYRKERLLKTFYDTPDTTMLASSDPNPNPSPTPNPNPNPNADPNPNASPNLSPEPWPPLIGTNFSAKYNSRCIRATLVVCLYSFAMGYVLHQDLGGGRGVTLAMLAVYILIIHLCGCGLDDWEIYLSR